MTHFSQSSTKTAETSGLRRFAFTLIRQAGTDGHFPALRHNRFRASPTFVRINRQNQLHFAMKRILLALLAAAGLQAVAQNETDILRYSTQMPAGSGRALAMGGAFGAVGADLSAGAINPAGLGLYRRSVMSFSTGMLTHNNQADFMGEVGSDTRTALVVGNWGMAFSTKTGRKEGLRRWTFAFGQNQLANYNRNLLTSAYNTQSSITDYFANEANGKAANQLSGLPAMAYQTYLINPIFDASNQYFGSVQNGEDKTDPLPGGGYRVRGVQQSLSQRESGRNNEWFIGTGFNVSDMLYVGAAMGIQQVRYNRVTSITEEDINKTHKWYVDSLNNVNGYPLEFEFKKMSYEEMVDAAGTGVNLKLGAILEPFDYLRLGVSIQTPTTLEMREVYSYSMSNDLSECTWCGTTAVLDSTSDGSYDYRMITPFRATASAMVLLGKAGFVSADVEMVDYSQGLLKSNYNDNPFAAANNAAAKLYQSAINYRVGAELRAESMRLRGGFALYGSPLTEAASQYLAPDGTVKSIDMSTKYYSLGVGIREKSYFADLTWMLGTGYDKFRPYNLSDTEFSPTVVNKYRRTNITFTVGFILGSSEE